MASKPIDLAELCEFFNADEKARRLLVDDRQFDTGLQNTHSLISASKLGMAGPGCLSVEGDHLIFKAEYERTRFVLYPDAEFFIYEKDKPKWTKTRQSKNRKPG